MGAVALAAKATASVPYSRPMAMMVKSTHGGILIWVSMVWEIGAWFHEEMLCIEIMFCFGDMAV